MPMRLGSDLAQGLDTRHIGEIITSGYLRRNKLVILGHGVADGGKEDLASLIWTSNPRLVC